MLDANIEKNNNERIKYLVKEHFSLTEESYNFFSKEIDSRNLLKTYKDFLEKNNSTNLRVSFDLPTIYRERLDNGWSFFKNTFSNFCNNYLLGYDNFVANKVTINKNDIKLRKAIVSFYTKKENYQYTARDIFRTSSSIQGLSDIENKIIKTIDSHLLEVSKICLPKSSIKMVVSLNFADWFLCSTAENWKSCLNLESEFHAAYWAGLPGLIGDKNRCMIYITDGNTKTYQGITVERIIARSWGMLGHNNKLYIVKPYPLPNLFDYRTVKEVTGLETESFNDGNFYSKEPADLLYFNSKDAKKTSFIFQDLIGFHPEKIGSICYQGRNGFYVYVNGKLHVGKQIINYTGGFSELVKNNTKIEEYFLKPILCGVCGTLIDRERVDRVTFYNEETKERVIISICRDCLHEMKKCEICGLIHVKNSKHTKVVNGDIICDDCFDKHFFTCEDCGKYYRKSEVKKMKDKYGTTRKICKSCFETWYAETHKLCIICGWYHHKDDLIRFEELEKEFACKNCMKHDLTSRQFFLKL